MLNDTLMITLLILAGADKEDVDIKSNEYWEYYKSTYGENNLIILKRNKK